METKKIPLSERRRYKRLEHIYPVEFRVIDVGSHGVGGWRQAFTQDVGEGGLYLTVNHLTLEDIAGFATPNTLLMLNINIPLKAQAVAAVGRLRWFKKLKSAPISQYALGVSYEKIESKDNLRILRYAGTRIFIKALAVTCSLLLSIGLVAVGFHNTMLRYENELLLAQYQTILQSPVKLPAQVPQKTLFEKRILNKLRQWLAVHQSTQTGLIVSFEGDRDLNHWAFTYDQALAAIAFVKSQDFKNARRIFDFYARAPQTDSGGYANAYDAATAEIAEFTTHAGPNIWLGISILQYTYATKDTTYMNGVRDIARWLETFRDPEGGLRGGRDVSWYSTEHNLDAYAFYTMAYQLTGDETFRLRGEESLQWLNKNAYSRLNAPFVKRGKGDATIATDTYAWSITAIGPERLAGNGMDPDAIADFAVAECGVSVDYSRPDGRTLRIKGFDFAKPQNLARGGVISCEWSAQMILALKIMANYHADQGNELRAHAYAKMANEYICELSKMITTSPSPVGQGEFCLPYASQQFVDTGHGWRTPRGQSTGSVAATAYAFLAISGENPLAFGGPLPSIEACPSCE